MRIPVFVCGTESGMPDWDDVSEADLVGFVSEDGCIKGIVIYQDGSMTDFYLENIRERKDGK